MRCPADVPTQEFRHMLATAPEGAKLLKSKRRQRWREFTFRLTKPRPERKVGDTLIWQIPCKFQSGQSV